MDLCLLIFNENHRRVIAVETVLVADNIYVEQVTSFELIRVGQAMANDIIHAEADALREVHEVDGRRVRIISDNVVMDDLVEFNEGHAWL